MLAELVGLNELLGLPAVLVMCNKWKMASIIWSNIDQIIVFVLRD